MTTYDLLLLSVLSVILKMYKYRCLHSCLVILPFSDSNIPKISHLWGLCLIFSFMDVQCPVLAASFYSMLVTELPHHKQDKGGVIITTDTRHSQCQHRNTWWHQEPRAQVAMARLRKLVQPRSTHRSLRSSADSIGDRWLNLAPADIARSRVNQSLVSLSTLSFNAY